MRKIKLPQNFDGPALPQTDGGCRPLADAVDRQNGCLIKRGRIKGAGGVRKMMFREKQFDPAGPMPAIPSCSIYA